MSKKVKIISQRQLLYYAEILFKMAFAMHDSDPPKFNYLEFFSWSKHSCSKKDLELTSKEEELAIALFHHVAIYVFANQMDTYLQNSFNDRFTHSDNDLRNAAWIVRLIRNAFAHNPFYPQWQFYNECKNKTYAVKDIISLNTKNINGKIVNRYDYGGPLALLRLSEYIRGLACEKNKQS